MAERVATVKNWGTFQHYKDRSPPWIKLHRALLDNREYHLLSPLAAKMLPLVWLIASEAEGALPEDEELAFRLRISPESAASVVEELVRRAFLVWAGTAQQVATPAQPAKRNGWASRHIAQPIRIEVWNRDGGKCVWCGATEKIEYDHVVPISKGGESTACNLQLLCRACNRKKRTKVAAQVATQPLGMRSLETETETEKETPLAPAAPSEPDGFARFWAAYPKRRREKKAEALKVWKQQGLEASADLILAHVTAQSKTHDWQKDGGQFVPQPPAYLRGKRWLDAEPVAEQPATPVPERRKETPEEALAAMQAHFGDSLLGARP